MTTLDLITRAYKLLGISVTGEPLDPGDVQDGLDALNEMLESWATEPLSVYNITEKKYPLVSGQQKYTIGTGGNFNTDRPVWVDTIKLISLADPTNPLYYDLENLTDGQWADVRLKSLTSSLCTKVWFNQSYPLAELYVWPVPNVSNLELSLWVPVPIAKLALTTVLSLPPGYFRALRYNLAIDLAPEHGKTLDPALAKRAIEAKADIQKQNDSPQIMACDGAFTGQSRPWNIFTGGY